MGLSAAILGAGLLVTNGPVTPNDAIGWTAVGWLGVANSAGAFVVMYLLLRRVSTAHISSLLNLVPAVTALASVPLLAEQLSVRYLIGLGVALAGMYLGLAQKARRTPTGLVAGRLTHSSPVEPASGSHTVANLRPRTQ